MTVVVTATGEVRGVAQSGIHCFKGIPYAEPISGERRWLPPIEREPWTGVRDATRFGAACPQEAPPNKWLTGRAGRAFIETLWAPEQRGDDCLNLNVWTSTVDSNAALPVMVWIHGGAFTTGSGSLPIYDGSRLAAKGVVVVSINYRLGMMGSFVAPGMFDDEFCGPNRGFRDQIAALRWVQTNIEAFGGDPGNVTIFGESAGGQSVAVLLASPLTSGLFRRAIAQSGTPEFGTPVDDHRRFAPDLLAAMDIPPSRSALAALNADDTITSGKAARKVLAKGTEAQYGDLLRFGHVGCVHGDDLLPHPILESLEQGAGTDVDLLIGTVREDGRLFPLVMPGPERVSSWLCMKLFGTAMGIDGRVDAVMDRYRAVLPDASTAELRGQILTDWMFRQGTIEAAERHRGSTYLYQFDWASPVAGIGAMHGVDVPFAFDNLEPFAPILGDLAPLRELADSISDTWVAFARDGSPQSASLPHWPAFDTERRATMVVDSTTVVVDDHARPWQDAWSSARSN